MRRHLFAPMLAVLLCAGAPATAGELSPDDAAALRAEVRAMVAAFSRGDAAFLIARTHPSLKRLAGGDEAFARIAGDAAAQLRSAGVEIVSEDVGIPGRTYAAGEEEVCFVPRHSLMRVRGTAIRSTTFMVAVRRVGDPGWTYLDGSGLQDNPGLLRQLLPALEAGVLLPERHIEAL